ncbi:hypothetical protein [uncultured Methanobrevibacter sp.]|uniref:hypothetical protein n=1 Tax=uncultured Methanobrevibacter sp. TaxID=253161 RepID=UPI002600E35B|nr:hypothetical protein [uncultured Methanobrevibacter sp.]
MAKKEVDIEKEVERLSRKSNIKMRKTEYSYTKRLQRLDKEIDRAVNDKIKFFDENNEINQEYSELEFKHDTINRYREKLKKI